MRSLLLAAGILGAAVRSLLLAAGILGATAPLPEAPYPHPEPEPPRPEPEDPTRFERQLAAWARTGREQREAWQRDARERLRQDPVVGPRIAAAEAKRARKAERRLREGR